MAELKPQEFDAAASRIAGLYRLFLVFGPDRGLVSERAATLAKASGVALDDPFSVVRLDGNELSGDPGRLVDEAQSIGLFGGSKLVWVKASGTEKPLIDGCSVLLSRPIDGATIIIEAGDLKRGTGLRKLVEASREGVGIPCYADDARSLNALIDRELAAESLSITAPARQALIEALGGDRLASRNEIRKLALYARGEAVIDVHHVREIVGDASAVSADDAVTAILSGDPHAFAHAIRSVIASKTSVFIVLQACLRQLQLIDLMRAEMDEKGLSLQQAMAAHARGVFFKRKDAVEAALRTWTAPALAAEMNRLQSAILLTRQINALEDPIAAQTLLATTLQSRRR